MRWSFKLSRKLLKNGKQRDVLNGKASWWKNILAGVPQCCVLWPLLSLIYTIYLPAGIVWKCKNFAIDTYFFQ